ncbi:MAG: hypothetical protein KGJ88_05500 [Verrucomicrobiota bacterium]|nr:hypothetical protein [Verrucomicrobiota bacterium]
MYQTFLFPNTKSWLQRLGLMAFALFVLAGCRTDGSAAGGEGKWPARVFAPYMYVGYGDHFRMTDCEEACGQKFYTLAFIIADKSGKPCWDGRIPMSQNFYSEQIGKIRRLGGNVIVSFGGEAGDEPAVVQMNARTLEREYESVVDRYHFTWLDFDIEGRNLENRAANERRNSALAWLQRRHPGLIISYTLPVDPNGISADSRQLLADARAKGVNVHSADLMVMYFGKEFIKKGKSEAELGIESAETAHRQIQKIDPRIRIGLCPCLGRNGPKDEVFTLADARTLRAFADRTPWVCSLHFWCINDDAGTKNGDGGPWTFDRVFDGF